MPPCPPLQALTVLARLVCNIADCGNSVERFRSVKVRGQPAPGPACTAERRASRWHWVYGRVCQLVAPRHARLQVCVSIVWPFDRLTHNAGSSRCQIRGPVAATPACGLHAGGEPKVQGRRVGCCGGRAGVRAAAVPACRADGWATFVHALSDNLLRACVNKRTIEHNFPLLPTTSTAPEPTPPWPARPGLQPAPSLHDPAQTSTLLHRPVQILFLVGFKRQGGCLSVAADAPLGALRAAAARLRRLADKKGHSGAAEHVPPDGGRPASPFYGQPGFRYQEQVGWSPLTWRRWPPRWAPVLRPPAQHSISPGTLPPAVVWACAGPNAGCLLQGQAFIRGTGRLASTAPPCACCPRPLPQIWHCSVCDHPINDGSERLWTGRHDAPHGEYRRAGRGGAGRASAAPAPAAAPLTAQAHYCCALTVVVDLLVMRLRRLQLAGGHTLAACPHPPTPTHTHTHACTGPLPPPDCTPAGISAPPARTKVAPSTSVLGAGTASRSRRQRGQQAAAAAVLKQQEQAGAAAAAAWGSRCMTHGTPSST